MILIASNLSKEEENKLCAAFAEELLNRKRIRFYQGINSLEATFIFSRIDNQAIKYFPKVSTNVWRIFFICSSENLRRFSKISVFRNRSQVSYSIFIYIICCCIINNFDKHPISTNWIYRLYSNQPKIGVYWILSILFQEHTFLLRFRFSAPFPSLLILFNICFSELGCSISYTNRWYFVDHIPSKCKKDNKNHIYVKESSSFGLILRVHVIFCS